MGLPSLLGKRRDFVLLLVLFLVCSAVVLSFHHSFERPTIPDEAAYYGWAQLFNRGYLAVPLQDWTGLNERAPSSRIQLFANASGVHFLRIRADVASLDAIGAANDVSVSVTWETAAPVPGAKVTARPPPPAPPITVNANATGEARFLNLPKGLFPVETVFGVPQPPLPPWQLRAGVLVSIGRDDRPYQTYLEVDAHDPATREVVVRARDSFNASLAGARVNLTVPAPGGPVVRSTALTDAGGRARFTLSAFGGYEVAGSKAPVGDAVAASVPGANAMASVVVVDGAYYMVNRWPPGYQILLAPFVAAGLAEFATLVLMAVASTAVHLATRRCFGERAALLATVLFLTCGLALIMVWEVGMADYASTAFAILGLALFLEALGREGGRGWVAPVLHVAAGLSLGASVWVRYSTATVAAVPLVYLVVLLFKESREDRGRLVPTKAAVVRGIRRAAPLLLGLALLGVPLAQYNATYFGSPFATGYNFGRLTVEGDGANATGALSGGTFYENFNPAASLGTVPYRVAYLLALAPFVALIVPAAWTRRRNPLVWFLVGAFLANFLLYLFVPWVAAQPGNALLATEEMRYFLPGIPPAAVLAGLYLKDLWEGGARRRLLAIGLLAAFLAAGFVAAAVGIQLQLGRLLGPPPAP